MSERSRVDHYEILETLGRGTTATVKLARNLHTGEVCAIKILKLSTPTLASHF